MRTLISRARRFSAAFFTVVGVLLAGCEVTVSGTATSPSGANKYRDPVTFDPCTDFPQAAFDAVGVKRRETGEQRADLNIPYTEADGGPEMHIGCYYHNDQFSMTIWAENVGLEARRKAIGKIKIWDTTLTGRNAVMTIPDNFGSCNMYVEVPGGAITMLQSNAKGREDPTIDECAAVIHHMTLLEPFFPKQI
ncbi:MAG: DUF3558 domain-containing protein [Mycobacteriaceae bacterium]